jgi:hypothetical protein
MRRLLSFLAVPLLVAAAAQAGNPVWVTPDVPTDEGLNGTTLLPWEIYRYDGTAYTLELSVPGAPDVDAIHRLDDAGDWLFSVDAPSELGGLLLPPGSIAEPRDLIHYDAAAGTFTLCFSGAAAGLPASANVDAVVMDGGDATCSSGTGGTLLLSFDAPTSILPFPAPFEPADLVRFVPLGIGTCPGWTIAAANPAFDASAAGLGIAISSATDGADRATDYSTGVSTTVLAFDVPTDVAPPAATYVPGQLVASDALGFSLFESLGGWPISSLVDGLSCGGNAGRVPANIIVDKAVAPAGDLVITWSASCSQGADDYGIYEGTLGVWYSHTANDCLDDGPPLTEQITPMAPGDRYFLVVPYSGCRGEGSYGSCNTAVCLAGDERPPGGATCAKPHVVTCCP